MDEASLRGRMDPKDVERLQTYIREWCLREEAPVNIFVDEIENRNNPEAIRNIQEEVKEPLFDLGPDRLRFQSPALTEPVLSSSLHEVPPTSSCPSVPLRVSSCAFLSNFG